MTKKIRDSSRPLISNGYLATNHDTLQVDTIKKTNEIVKTAHDKTNRDIESCIALLLLSKLGRKGVKKRSADLSD